MDSKERFSLLLLEPNEIYFEDFAVELLPDIESPTARKSPAPSSASSTSFASGGGLLLHINNAANIGRLKVCSKSLVYVPRCVDRAIQKIALRDCSDIYHWPQGLFEHNRTGAEVLAVRCTQIVSLLAGNRLTPYEFSGGSVERLLRFKLQYARVEQHLQMMCQLRRAATLHAMEQNDMIATMVLSRNNRLRFDRLWLDDFDEPICVDHIVDEISPLVTNPGRLLLTTRSIYFQPFNNILPYPVLKIPLSTINTVTQRRILLRHTGLEIQYTSDTASAASAEPNPGQLLYVSFRAVRDRFDFVDRLHRQSALRLRDTPPETMTLRWQNGLVSNFDYLQHLNSRADRTRRDLTQYPIFPWVLADYTSAALDLSDARIYRDLSKPVGALNAERLQRLRERSDEMGEPKFLYGSHYSAPALVLFYLVRQHPKLMLCLQNGRFDHPDRMFNSVAETFENCLRNMSDFKELIPEFYDTNAEHVGEFLLNTTRTNFGARCNGQAVHHVRLPPWAHGSPERFVALMREALESEHVSRNLHHWIDLIFGYKQRGQEARKADNLFYHLCYEGSVDLDRVPDLAARHALEVQISEFGQIPRQLFDQPHVQRLQFTAPPATPTPIKPAATAAAAPAPSCIAAAAAADRGEEEATVSALQLCGVSHSHKDLICCVSQLAVGNRFMSTGKDGLLKWYDLDRILRQINAERIGAAGDQSDSGGPQPSSSLAMPCRSVAIDKVPLSACAPIAGCNRVVLSSWNDSIITYNMDYGRITNTFTAHDDVVSCLSLVDSENLGLLVSGSWDCSVKVWSDFGRHDTQQSFRSTDALLTYLQLDDKIAAMHAIPATSSAAGIRILIGTFGGDVFHWPLAPATRREHLQTPPHENHARRLHRHGDEVTAVRFGAAGRRAASCGLDGVLLVSDVETGMRLLRAEHAVAWCCLTWLPPLTVAATSCGGGGAAAADLHRADSDLLLLGDDRGAISVWSMRTGDGKCIAESAFGADASSAAANAGGLVGGLAAARRYNAIGRAGLVSALAASRQKMVPQTDDVRIERDSKDSAADGDDDDVVLVMAAGVDGPGEFSVKVFRVIV